MGIANIINNSTTTSGGEIVRELVNSSDGQGLNFDGAAGAVTFTPVDLGTAFSFEFIIKADSWGSGQYLIDFGTGGRFFISSESGNSYNLGIFSVGGSTASFGVKVLDDLKVHHLVVTVDGTAATLFDNGNQVATATITSPNIDSCSAAALGANFPADDLFFNGTIYRARFYNKTLSSTEVQTAFERADVDFADQYGSQTYIIDSSFASSTQSFNGAGGTTAANIDSIGGQNDTLRFTTDSSTGNHQILRVCPRDKGKNVRVQGMVYIPSTNTNLKKVQINENGNADIAVIKEITTLDAWVSFDEIHVWTDYDELRFRGLKADGTTSYAGNGSDVFYIKNIKVNNAGCVSDYQTSAANPLQSLTVQDASGAADGSASSSTAVTQVQPIIQGNMRSLAVTTTSQAAGVPADGQIISQKLLVDGDGGGSAPVDANTHLVIDDTDHAYLGIYGSGDVGIHLGDTVIDARIRYRNSTRALGISAGGTEDQITLDGSGNVTVSGPQLEITDDLSGAHTTLKLKNTSATASIGSQIQLHDHDSYFYQTIVDSDLRFYNGAERFQIGSDGVINIPNLSASSDVQTDGSKNLITSSDKRLKNDIGELTAGLDIISNLEPHYFSWKNDETNTQQLGFFAQDVYEFLPEAAPREQKQNLVTPAVAAAPATYYEEGDELPEGVAVGDEKTAAVEAVEAVYEPATNEDGTPDYNWGFNGRPIIAALVAAVKELKAKVETLENE